MHAEFVLGLGLDFGIESFKSSSSVPAIPLSKCGRQGLVMCWYRLFSLFVMDMSSEVQRNWTETSLSRGCSESV